MAGQEGFRDDKAPLFMLHESDGPCDETRLGRTAQSKIDTKFHCWVEGRSRPVVGVVMNYDRARDKTTVSVTLDGMTHTKTFDGRR